MADTAADVLCSSKKGSSIGAWTRKVDPRAGIRKFVSSLVGVDDSSRIHPRPDAHQVPRAALFFQDAI
jgi:hypothetical protein